MLIKIKPLYLFYNQNINTMKVVVNNIAKDKAKKVMDALFECMNDKNLSKEERKQYYQDYLEVSANYLILCR